MRCARLGVLFPLLLSLWACDSSKSEASKKGASAEARLERARGAMEEAKKAGADKLVPRDFEAHLARLKDAEALIEEGKPEKALSKLAQAASGFGLLATNAGEVRKLREAALEAKKKPDKAIADAKRNKWDVGAQEVFDQITKLMVEAQADLDSGDRTKLQALPRSYTRVVELVQRAKEESQASKKYKDMADAQKKGMLEAQAKAVEAKAEAQAADAMARAQQNVREADVEYQNGNFRQANELYKTAENIYLEAVSYARASVEPANTPVVEVTPPPQAPVKAAHRKQADADPVPVPEVVQRDGELSPEDEAFLIDNWQKFCSKVSPTFDPVTGEFTVEYPFGDEMRRDLLFPKGPIPPKQIFWKDMMLGLNAKQAGGKKELGCTFSANTGGFFLLPFPFKDRVTVEYRLELGMMKNEGAVTTILASSPDGRNYYGVNFASIENWRDGKKGKVKPPNDPKAQRSPNYWWPKIRFGGVEMRVEYKPNPKKEDERLVEVWYDLGEDASDTPYNVMSVPARSGHVGFAWFQAKFNIRMLKISGILDKQAAVKFLRAKLGEGEQASGGGLPPKEPKEPASKAKPKSGKKKAEEGEETAGATPPAKPPSTKKKPASDTKAGKEDEADY